MVNPLLMSKVGMCYMNLATDITRLSACSICPALGKEHVPAEGPSNAEIFIVGQSPGVQEVEAGRPFVGPSGEMLDYFLDEAGLDRSDVYITNAVKCHPPGNRAGHPEELRSCFDRWLRKELAFIMPNVVIMLGKDAWQSVSRGKFEFKHGGITKTSKGTTFLTLYHPAYFIRRNEVETFIKAGQILKEILHGTSTEGS